MKITHFIQKMAGWSQHVRVPLCVASRCASMHH